MFLEVGLTKFNETPWTSRLSGRLFRFSSISPAPPVMLIAIALCLSAIVLTSMALRCYGWSEVRVPDATVKSESDGRVT